MKMIAVRDQARKANNYQFTALLDGLEYQKHCPLCGSKLEPTDGARIEYSSKLEPTNGANIETPYQSGNHKTLIWLTLIDETITIDLHTQSITITHPLKEVYGSIRYPTLVHTAGVLRVECSGPQCLHYGFALWVEICPENVLSVFLQNEWIEDGGLGLFTWYANPRSYFYHWSREKGRDKFSKEIDLPFIPIDLNAPRNALQRAKNLVAFL